MCVPGINKNTCTDACYLVEAFLTCYMLFQGAGDAGGEGGQVSVVSSAKDTK